MSTADCSHRVVLADRADRFGAAFIDYVPCGILAGVSAPLPVRWIPITVWIALVACQVHLLATRG